MTSLYDLIPREAATADALLGKFLEYVEARKLTLYAAQEAAILELFEEKNVILNTPTGSGKSLVATALHFGALARGRRSVYTCPIKALVNEKFMALCREFGPENVGLSHGRCLDVNREAYRFFVARRKFWPTLHCAKVPPRTCVMWSWTNFITTPTASAARPGRFHC